MPLTWRQCVLDALRRYTVRNQTSKVERRPFLDQELAAMSAAVGSIGRTPGQTVSRVLQELRDEGALFFSATGVYVLTDQPIDLTREDLPDDIVENAIGRDALRVGDIPVREDIGAARLRVGQRALRRLTLMNYRGRCALCDTEDPVLLVASHVARWSDRADARGKLSNTICFCAMHDRLFEHGYFGLQNDLGVVVRSRVDGAALRTWLAQCTSPFRPPVTHRPMADFLREHRQRVGLSGPDRVSPPAREQ